MTLDPNNARAGVARYLVGPVPPTPQDLILARLHGALDGGAVEHPWNLNANLRLHWQATPRKIQAPCKVLRLPSGDMVRLGDDLWPISVSACTAATAIFTGVRVRHAFGLGTCGG
jgi:hypothetical protein